jgi:hypothetical protein
LHLRQPRAAMVPCSNATADWARQHNDDLEDRAIGAASYEIANRMPEAGGITSGLPDF